MCPFSMETWNSLDQPIERVCSRSNMVGDLQYHYLNYGMTLQDVINLLGRFDEAQNCMQYELGACANRNDIMNICFNEDGDIATINHQW